MSLKILMGFLTKKVKDTNILGIDLGTTNTVAAIMIDNKPTIIADGQNKLIPSIVHFKDKDKVTVGTEAKRLLEKHQDNTIYASKRLIGRKLSEVDDFVKTLPYKTTSTCSGDVWIQTDFGKFSPAVIGGKILNYVKGIGQKFLKKEKLVGNSKIESDSIQRAVVTVPAYFNDIQRQETKNAGKEAGLDVVRIINEPTAAALAYGYKNKYKGEGTGKANKSDKKGEIVAVYDLGGGTFDVSILELSDGLFYVKSTNGNTFLGGEDFDAEFVKLICDLHQTEETQVIDLSDRETMNKIKHAAEKAKKQLSDKTTTSIYVENVKTKEGASTDIDMDVSRTQLENVVKKVAMKTVDSCKEAMKDAGVTPKDIDKVVLVGGMTRMPYIRKLTEDIFKQKPDTSINPDEAVAKGAAIQAGIISGSVQDTVLLDVIPMSLGIETVGGVFSKIVEKNTTIPFKQEEIFTTSKDNQTEVAIKIYQGDSEKVDNNKYLGELLLKDIPPAPKNEPKIKVVFTTNNNGILKVFVEDQVTKKHKEILLNKS